MSYLARVIFIAGTLLSAARGVAADSIYHVTAPKHSLAACMSRHMSADKSLSYNEATKVCKVEIKEARPALASVSRSVVLR